METVQMAVCLLTLAMLAATSTTQDVREPPSIQEPATDAIPHDYIQRRGSFQLPCEATGHPEPIYGWLHYARKLDLNKTNIRRLENGTIQISNFQTTDQGEYQCVASNKYGTSLSQIFKVMVAFVDESGHQEIETYSVKLGSFHVVPKRRVYVKPESWYELMTVRSIGDLVPRKVELDEHVNIDPAGNVYFTSVQASDALEDGRFYKLVVHNAALRQSLGVRYFRINVNTSVTPIDQRPVILFPNTSQTVSVLEGTGRRMPCVCSGYPLVDITWTGPPQSLSTRENSGTSLVLDRMTKEAEGAYTCSCNNRVGTANITVTVNMHTLPKFTEGGRPSKQTLTEGETATFTCQTTEDTTPQATVDWMINGVLLQDHSPGARTKVTNIQNGKTLTINDVNRDGDIKVVQCKVSNKYGTSYAEAALSVVLDLPDTGSRKLTIMLSIIIPLVAVGFGLLFYKFIYPCMTEQNKYKDPTKDTKPEHHGQPAADRNVNEPKQNETRGRAKENLLNNKASVQPPSARLQATSSQDVGHL